MTGLSAAGAPWGDDEQGTKFHESYGPLVKRIEQSAQILATGLASIHTAMADMADGHIDNEQLIRSMFSRIDVPHDTGEAGGEFGDGRGGRDGRSFGEACGEDGQEGARHEGGADDLQFVFEFLLRGVYGVGVGVEGLGHVAGTVGQVFQPAVLVVVVATPEGVVEGGDGLALVVFDQGSGGPVGAGGDVLDVVGEVPPRLRGVPQPVDVGRRPPHARQVGVTVTAEVATIAGTTLATAAIAGIESVTVDLAVAQPVSIALGEQKGLSLDEARDAAAYGALLGGGFGGGGAAVRAASRAGGWSELLGGVRLPGLSPGFALPGGATASADDLGLLMKGDGEPNAWPRSKRKGAVKPKYRADLAGDEGKGTARSHSHTLEKHAEKTDRELRARLRAEKRITGSSSFISPEAAQDLTDRAIVQRQHDVRRWLENTRKPELTFRVDFGEEVTGRSLSREDFIRGTGPHNAHKVFLLLRRDPDMPSGYRIHTSYPTS